MKGWLFIAPVFLLFLVVSCQEKKAKPIASEKYISSSKTHFSIKDSSGLIILKVINPFSGGSYSEKYVLYPAGSKKPEVHATHLISVPVNSVAINSTTHLGYLSELGELKSVNAATNLDLYYNKEFRELIRKGVVQSVGQQELNTEQLLIEKSAVFFHYVIDAGDLKKLNELRDLNQKVVLIAEYMEQDPLKKAEWLKFFACFYGEAARKKADSIYRNIESAYSEIKNEVATSAHKPGVMIGLPWKGSWFVSGGNSYQAKLIEDAGGNYLWSEYKKEGGVPLDVEKVYLKAEEADVWINPGIAASKKEILDMNENFSFFSAFKKNAIYTNYKRSNRDGANDYWESGVVRPDLILKDLNAIFKMNAEPDSGLTYYKKLP